MEACLNILTDAVWGVPMLVLILGVGIFLSFRTRFAQFRLFPGAVKQFLTKLKHPPDTDGVSPFQALCTALAATVGTGNLVGVAGAIALGGPGSIFWMWICAFLGMATKYAEAALAVYYRTQRDGETVGGPMYMIRAGLGRALQPLAGIYAFLGVFAAFGVGNATQINAVVTGINQAARFFGAEITPSGNLLLGICLAVLVGAMLLGGAKRIGSAAELLVPFASCAYLALCIGVLIVRMDRIPAAFVSIIRGAFSPRAVTGGVVGSSLQTLRIGVSRGVFTNEAGMGTASIAHASADAAHPAQQGMMGIMEVFLDTVVICTMTALAILCSGADIPYGEDVGAALTLEAFTAVYGGWVCVFLASALCCFAFATVLGWGLYGARCAQFLLGNGSWKPFALLQSGIVVLGAVLKTDTIWSLAEIFNGLMAIPNLIALVCLSGKLRQLTTEYILLRGCKAAGGTYENFHQCKPLSAFSHAQVPPLRAGSEKTG